METRVFPSTESGQRWDPARGRVRPVPAGAAGQPAVPQTLASYEYHVNGFFDWLRSEHPQLQDSHASIRVFLHWANGNGCLLCLGQDLDD
jgi:hypothetical protein